MEIPLFSVLKTVLPGRVYRAAASTRSVFADIYANNVWGGEEGDIFSGPGSRGTAALAYVETVAAFAGTRDITDIVDLGCGDFEIGRQIIARCLPRRVRYAGVDVVPAVIERNARCFGDPRVSFACRDIVTDALPEGELCLVRQVFQHLSIGQVQRALSRLRKYRYVVITEHHPPDERFRGFNFNKVQGGDIRLARGSGIYLDRRPFNLRVQLLLEVALKRIEEARVPEETGFLRSYLWEPGR